MTEVVAALDSVVLHAPIHVGDVVLQNVCGTGADIVTCVIWHKYSPFYTISKAAAASYRAAAALLVGKSPIFK